MLAMDIGLASDWVHHTDLCSLGAVAQHDVDQWSLSWMMSGPEQCHAVARLFFKTGPRQD